MDRWRAAASSPSLSPIHPSSQEKQQPREIWEHHSCSKSSKFLIRRGIGRECQYCHVRGGWDGSGLPVFFHYNHCESHSESNASHRPPHTAISEYLKQANAVSTKSLPPSPPRTNLTFKACHNLNWSFLPRRESAMLQADKYLTATEFHLAMELKIKFWHGGIKQQNLWWRKGVKQTPPMAMWKIARRPGLEWNSQTHTNTTTDRGGSRGKGWMLRGGGGCQAQTSRTPSTPTTDSIGHKPPVDNHARPLLSGHGSVPRGIFPGPNLITPIGLFRAYPIKRL